MAVFVTDKKKHFLAKIQATHEKIWDLEFMREKYKAVREGIRQEYDRLQEQVDAATMRIGTEKEKEDPDKTIMENLEKLLTHHNGDIAQLKQQMADIDAQVDPTGELAKNIDGYREVLIMLKDYIKKL